MLGVLRNVNVDPLSALFDDTFGQPVFSPDGAGLDQRGEKKRDANTRTGESGKEHGILG